jgi:hypothetical protein
MTTPGTETTWADTYQTTVDAFGGTTPGQQLETQILTHYQQHPAATQTAINKIAARYKDGKIHSPWPLLLKELQRATEREHITANQDRERDQAIHLTEIYITNAGLYIPTETELLDDAFGNHGRLKQWADDQQLRDRIAEHWRQQQPRIKAAQPETLQRTTTIDPNRDIDWPTQ